MKKIKHTSRNLLHDHPLLRRCSAHDKNHKTKRRSQKVALRREWPVQSAFA